MTPRLHHQSHRRGAGLVVIIVLAGLFATTGLSASHATQVSFSGKVSAGEADFYNVTIAEPSTITAVLSWGNRNADLNLGLGAPSGGWVRWASSYQDNPESITYQATVVGAWRLGVAARTGSSKYDLQVTHQPAPTTTTSTTSPPTTTAPTTTSTTIPPTTTSTTTTSTTTSTTIPPTTTSTTTPPTTTSTTTTTVPPATTFPGVADWGVEQEAPTHTWTETAAVQHAKRFNFITALRNSYRVHVPAMKRANPNLTLYAYMNGGFAYSGDKDTYPAHWYLYDSMGQKIQNNWGIWLMDTANPDWVTNRINECKAALQLSGYDGCFVDNLGVGSLWGLSGRPINPRTGQPLTNSEWLNATVELASKMRSALGPIILVNGLVDGVQYASQATPSSRLLVAAGQGLSEAFNRTANAGPDDYRSEAAWVADINMLSDATTRGIRVTTITKVWVTATDAKKAQLHRYALGSFLLGNNGRGLFHFSYGKGSDNMANNPLHDQVRLGPPVAAYGKVSGAYQRSFENGRVIVNPSTASVTVPLDRTFTDVNGVRHQGSITVAAHDAVFLLNS